MRIVQLVTAVLLSTSLAHGLPIVQNGDFSTDPFVVGGGWTRTGDAFWRVSDADVMVSNGSSSGSGSISQNVNGFVAGETYLLTFDVSGQGMVAADIDGVLLGADPVAGGHTASFTAAGFSTGSHVLTISGTNINTSESVIVDNVAFSLAGAPEIDPASGSIPLTLILSGLLLFSHRRRIEPTIC